MLGFPGAFRLNATVPAQLARRRGNSIATTAIARRLLARSFHILKEVPTAATATTGEGQTGCARNNRMRLQHGR